MADLRLASGAMLGVLVYAVVVLTQWALGYVVLGGVQTGSAPRSVFLGSLAHNPGIGFGEELAFRGPLFLLVRNE
ncbi:MAG: hypothetical protein DMF79_16380 [Acidobacteria bacterium]|nr:MAG: hypothetical protein DMF79_16380 [Acidobacteriota bacterium]